ncbi:hypothetical protein ES703_99649 [subsurface metagenome]
MLKQIDAVFKCGNSVVPALLEYFSIRDKHLLFQLTVVSADLLLLPRQQVVEVLRRAV